MSPAKLRRSRDVSELHPVKIKNVLRLRDLATSKVGIFTRPDGQELALQLSGLIVKSWILALAQRTRTQHFSCVRRPTAGFRAGGLSL
jgi:hypothetical protein